MILGDNKKNLNVLYSALTKYIFICTGKAIIPTPKFRKAVFIN